MRYLAAIAATALLGFQAHAATIDTFNLNTASAILAASGGKNIKSEVIDNTTFINFDLDGLTYSTSLRLCSDDKSKGCLGFLLAVAFEADGTDTLDIVNQFNANAPWETAVKVDSKTIAFGRFVLAAGGIEPANVAGNLELLKLAPELYFKFKKQSVVASNGPGNTAVLSMPMGANGQNITMRPVKLNAVQLRALMNDSMTSGVKFR